MIFLCHFPGFFCFKLKKNYNLGLTKDAYICIVYTNKRNKHKVGFIMNKDEEGVDDDVWFSDAPPTICL